MSDERSISEAAVTKATGHGWAHWLGLLDRWGAAAKGHPATARHLREVQGLSPWWAQMVTVRYEQERGLRVRHERPGGFTVSVTRTIAVPVAEAWAAFTTAKGWNRWFTTKARLTLREGGRYRNADGDTGAFRAIVAGKRLCFTWENAAHCPGTLVDVRFAAKGRGRSTVALEHQRLASAADAATMKEGWSWAMDSLRAWLETGAPIRHEDWLAARKARRRAPAPAKR
jgi:uncharacterized protein YndB with AHSA1/START domain